MNKTFTAAIALTAIAGLAAAATIETPAAGYIEADAGAAQYVCNPFASFTGNTPTLADIDGSLLNLGTDQITILLSTGKKAFVARYLTAEQATEAGKTDGAGWYAFANNAYGECKNSYQLVRGTAIQFSGKAANGGKLVMAGTLDSTATSFTFSEGGYHFVGNATVDDNKTLADVELSGNAYNYATDFITLNGTKYVYLPKKVGNYAKGWYLYSAVHGTGSTAPQDEVPLVSGKGFIVFTKKTGATISVTAAN